MSDPAQNMPLEAVERNPADIPDVRGYKPVMSEDVQNFIVGG